MGEDLAASTGEAAGAAVQHIHGPFQAYVLAEDADGQVREAIVVEIGLQAPVNCGLGNRWAMGKSTQGWPDRGHQQQDNHYDPPHLHHHLRRAGGQSARSTSHHIHTCVAITTSKGRHLEKKTTSGIFGGSAKLGR